MGTYKACGIDRWRSKECPKCADHPKPHYRVAWPRPCLLELLALLQIRHQCAVIAKWSPGEGCPRSWKEGDVELVGQCRGNRQPKLDPRLRAALMGWQLALTLRSCWGRCRFARSVIGLARTISRRRIRWSYRWDLSLLESCVAVSRVECSNLLDNILTWNDAINLQFTVDILLLLLRIGRAIDTGSCSGHDSGFLLCWVLNVVFGDEKSQDRWRCW